jgi:hypothetical protein
LSRPAIALSLATSAVCIAAMLLTAAVTRGLLGQQVSLSDPWLWLGLPPALAYAWAWRSGRLSPRFWTAIWLAFGALALANQLLGWLTIQVYGDWRPFGLLVAKHEPMFRWLLGSALLSKVHSGLVAWAGLPAGREMAGLFIRCAAIVVMTLGSIGLLRRWPDRLRVVLPTLTPIWLLFAAGHAEYYPFIAGVWVFTLVWVMERPLGQRSLIAVGILAALLHPLLYLGYAPHAALLLGAFALAAPRRGALALLWGGATAAVGVWLCWPKSFAKFLELLYRFEAPEKAITYPAYQGHGSGPGSVFFNWSYAFSDGHLWDLLLMQSLAGGLLIPGLALVGCAFLLRRRGGLRFHKLLEPRMVFLLAATGWHSYYFLRMRPVLGPIKDIDIFFACYLTFAFVAGFVFDRLGEGLGAGRPRVQSWLAPLVVAACLGSTAVAASNLLVHGIRLPQPRWGAAEFAVALQERRDPELVSEFRQGVEEGRVMVRRIDGNPDAFAAGLTFDRWTRGTGPAVLVLRNSSSEPVRARVRLLCYPPAEHLPVRVTLVEGQEAAREVVFLDPGGQAVVLGALAPGEERVVVLWTDKGWPGQEDPPRWLGVGIGGVAFEKVPGSS